MDTNHLKVTLTEGTTKTGLPVFLAMINPHSEEYKAYQVVLVQNGEKYICGQKGIYKSKASARKIYNQVVAAY